MHGQAPHQRGWRERALQRVHRTIARALPLLVRRSLTRDLAGVWGSWQSAPPPTGAVVVVNHHSWWDGYLAWLVARRVGRPFGVLVDDATLDRYPFFAHVGAIRVSALRSAVRHAAAGAWLFVFPEGRLRPAAALGSFAPGAATIARLAGVPVLPMAWRVRVRGAQYPEAYLRVGTVLDGQVAPEAQHAAVAALLERLDADLDAAEDPETPLVDYELWLAGRLATHERAQRWRRWWGGR